MQDTIKRSAEQADGGPRGAADAASARPERLADTPVLEALSDECDLGALRRVRAFHLGVGQRDALKPLGRSWLPALAWPFRQPQKVRNDYPLLLLQESSDDAERSLCPPLAESLEAMVPDSARILRDNVLRLEVILRDAIAKAGGLVDAKAALAEAGNALREQLGLGDDNASKLGADLDALVEAVPAGARLLGFSERSDVEMFWHLCQQRIGRRRAIFRQAVSRLAGRLEELLAVDQQKRPEGRDAASMAQAVGASSDLFDGAALAKLVGHHRGTAAMPPERRERIEGVLAAFRAFSTTEFPLMCVVEQGASSLPKVSGRTLERNDDPCQAAGSRFDELALAFADVFKAVRIAELELRSAEGAYDSGLHDAWISAFDWRAFDDRELALLPQVTALITDDQLASDGTISLSRLLLSGRPVSVLARVQPAKNPGAGAVSTNGAQRSSVGPLDGYRFELGYLGVSHREALVWQSSSSRPEHLMAGYERALAGTRAALYVVSSGLTIGKTPSRLGPWMHVASALEGRAHPFFGYDPQAGATWARRVDFAGNPSPEADWPVYPVSYRDVDGQEQTIEVAFTFADFAMLDPAFADHFRPLPPECGKHADLVALSEFLTLDGDAASRCIPYIWAVSDEAVMRRVALSRALALAARDRLGYWRTLQELSGIRNEHVERAIAEAETRAEAKAQERIRALEAEHAAALERVERETAAEAMGRLAGVLVDLDLGALSTHASRPAPVAKAPVATEVATDVVGETVVPEAEPEEALSFDEPWIDSPLCTSCNDCINLNRLLFVYDDNKQAMIADPKAGTFADLVEAAEKCPARCIHPGKPLDPDEPNIDDLLKRAEKFN